MLMGTGQHTWYQKQRTKSKSRPDRSSVTWNTTGCRYTTLLLKYLQARDCLLTVCLWGLAGIDSITAFYVRTKQGDRKSLGFRHLPAALFFMAGGSEDLWADTFPWAFPYIDLSVPFPPWSVFSATVMTHVPQKFLLKQHPITTHHCWHTHTIFSSWKCRRTSLGLCTFLPEVQMISVVPYW